MRYLQKNRRYHARESSLWAAFAAVLVSGCWRVDRPTLDLDAVPFAPVAAAPDGFVVTPVETTLECPDGKLSVMYVVHELGNPGPVSGAVLLHSGAFDYVTSASQSDPISGDHLYGENRLDRDWAKRRSFFALGMVADDVAAEDSTGALAAALAQRGVALLVPGNCWGDWWHNEVDVAVNDLLTDGFPRNGRGAAHWAWRVATEAGFAEAEGVELPTNFDASAMVLVGLGEGGRGVAELLQIGVQPAAVLFDSSADDLDTYADDPSLYGAVLDGIARIFTEGTDAGSIATVQTLPPRVAYVYSSLDSEIPAASHDEALARLADEPDSLIVDVGEIVHVATMADEDLAVEIAAYLTGQ